jgi:hypothetical protein
MLAPLHVHSRPATVRPCLFESSLAAVKQTTVKVGHNAGDRSFILGMLDPYEFVIARVVIFWKIDVVFPEKMVGESNVGWDAQPRQRPKA